MSTFVIVHGGCEWTPVARRLREYGHEVFTPTLTGLSEREHLTTGSGLAGHIEDILAVLRFEELRDVVLCGHSYGGMVVTGVADRMAERIGLLVYLDAFVPEHGQSLLDLLSDDFRDILAQGPGSTATEGSPVPPALLPPEGAIPEERRRSYIARLRPHPWATLAEAITLSGDVTSLRRAFVRCTQPPRRRSSRSRSKRGTRAGPVARWPRHTTFS